MARFLYRKFPDNHNPQRKEPILKTTATQKPIQELNFHFTEEDYILLREKDKIWISFINGDEKEKVFQQRVREERGEKREGGEERKEEEKKGEIAPNPTTQSPTSPWNCSCFVEGEVIEEISAKIKSPLKMLHILSNIMQLIHFRIGDHLKDIKVLTAHIQLEKNLIQGKILLMKLKTQEHLFVLMK